MQILVQPAEEKRLQKQCLTAPLGFEKGSSLHTIDCSNGLFTEAVEPSSTLGSESMWKRVWSIYQKKVHLVSQPCD